MPFVFGGAQNWAQAVSPQFKATVTSALTKLSKQRTQINFLTVYPYTNTLSFLFFCSTQFHSFIRSTTRSESNLFTVGGPIKHTKGMKFNQVFAFLPHNFYYRKFQYSRVVCLLQIKTGLVPPLQAELQTPTLSKTAVSCLTEPTHVILQDGSHMTSCEPCNKAFFASFYRSSNGNKSSYMIHTYQQNSMLCSNRSNYLFIDIK